MFERPEGGVVLILGSAPDAIRSRDWPREAFGTLVAINNAWRVREDWDYLIFPDDFPPDRRPAQLRSEQVLVQSQDYVPANNRYGGILYAGGTMAFTAGYWALAALQPAVLAFAGCDMVYPSAGKTHFYGSGDADPLRVDISLRNLEAKAARLALLAAVQGCACVRLSGGESRLVYPPVLPGDLAGIAAPALRAGGREVRHVRAEETRLGHVAETGRYWEKSFPTDDLDRLDQMWLDAMAAEFGGTAAPG